MGQLFGKVNERRQCRSRMIQWRSLRVWWRVFRCMLATGWIAGQRAHSFLADVPACYFRLFRTERGPGRSVQIVIDVAQQDGFVPPIQGAHQLERVDPVLNVQVVGSGECIWLTGLLTDQDKFSY